MGVGQTPFLTNNSQDVQNPLKLALYVCSLLLPPLPTPNSEGMGWGYIGILLSVRLGFVWMTTSELFDLWYQT